MADLQRAINELKEMLEKQERVFNRLRAQMPKDPYWRKKKDVLNYSKSGRIAALSNVLFALHERITELEADQHNAKNAPRNTLGKMSYDEWAKKNNDAKDVDFKQRFQAADRRHLANCFVATGKPDRAAANLSVRQDYYYFDGLKGSAEYDFPKPADADSIRMFVKLTTADPRPVNLYVDGNHVGQHLKTFRTRSYWNKEDLEWVPLGPFNCVPGKTAFKLQIVPVGYAPHIAAVAVAPFSRPTYERIHGLDFSNKYDVTNMKADNLDRVKKECEKHKCNVFVVAGGHAYLKRVVFAIGRPVHPPNKQGNCTMYVQKEFAAAIKAAAPR